MASFCRTSWLLGWAKPVRSGTRQRQVRPYLPRRGGCPGAGVARPLGWGDALLGWGDALLGVSGGGSLAGAGSCQGPSCAVTCDPGMGGRAAAVPKKSVWSPSRPGVTTSH